MAIKYSIIIPCKNNPQLICRAIRSIPEDESIEVILVDDNSDPHVIDFNRYPGYDRKNVSIVLSKSNKGAGHARNLGLEKANGKWVLFLDSDDFFEPNLIEKLDNYYDAVEDIIFFNLCTCYSDNYEYSDRLSGRIDLLHKKQDDNLEFYCRFRYTEPWGKMIRKSLIQDNNIKFDETICANDYAFSILTGFYAKKIRICDVALLCVTERHGSLSNNYYDSDEKWEARVKVTYRIQEFMDKNGIPLLPFYSLIIQSQKNSPRHYKYIIEFCKANGIGRYVIFKNCILKTIINKIFCSNIV